MSSPFRTAVNELERQIEVVSMQHGICPLPATIEQEVEFNIDLMLDDAFATPLQPLWPPPGWPDTPRPDSGLPGQ